MSKSRGADRHGQAATGDYIAQARDNSTAIVSVLQYRPPTPVTAEELALAEERLAAIETESIVRVGALPAGSRMPLSPNPLFVGRELDLRALARWVQVSGQAGSGSRPIAAVTGIGGVGKTQLAVEFVHRCGQFFNGGVFWLRFADPAAVAAEVAECGLGGSLGLRPDFVGLDLREQLALVLGAWQSPLPRLLVFDNCEDATLLDAWRPKSGGCRVLVTSRRATWAATLGVQVFPADVLPRAESVALLRRYLPDPSVEDKHLDDIAKEIGDLPLALNVAGSMLALYRHAITPAQYLTQLRGPDRFSVLEVPEDETAVLSPTQHAQSVRRTFALSYERLDPANAVDAMAQALLSRAACLASGEPIPGWFLRSTLGVVTPDLQLTQRIERSVTRLVDLGLLEKTADDALRMHRLIVTFVREDALEPDAQTAVEQALLQGAAATGTSRSSPRTLEAHLSFVTDAAAERGDQQAVTLCAMRGAQLRWFGDYPRAEAYFKQALALRRRLSPATAIEDLAFLYDVGFVLKDQGKFADALEYFEQAVGITAGRGDLSTSESLNNMGLAYKDLGRVDEARHCFERSLEITEAQGRHHPSSVAALHNLAWLLVDQGTEPSRAKARAYLEQALQIQRKTFGDGALQTVESLNGLGELLLRQGNFRDRPPYEEAGRRSTHTSAEPYAQARRYFEEALAIRKKELGDRHTDTAESLNNLGRLLARLNDVIGARGYFDQALAIQQEVLGQWHPRTGQIMANIGRLIFTPEGEEIGGDLWGAKTSLERAQQIFERSLGPEHPDTALVRSEISRIEARMEYWSSYYRQTMS